MWDEESNMNSLLILSCGTRNKIVQYFKNAVSGNGNVIATDCSSLAPALYDADRYYIVPRMTEEHYIDCILEICEKEKITGVLSLIDRELSLLAENRHRFEAIGTTVIGSAYEQCELALDKWKMFCWLQDHGFACAKTYIDFSEFEAEIENGAITFPVFVKPRFGSASIAISKAEDMETARFLFFHQQDMIVQEFLNGQEIGADCYIDMITHEPVAIFTKEKLKMRAGETDKARSFRDSVLFDLLTVFIRKSGFSAQIDIDVFRIDGKYYISEVNPRFGGGYPHAYECGVDTPSMILKNLAGEINDCGIGTYESGVIMMKYNELKVRSEKVREHL